MSSYVIHANTTPEELAAGFRLTATALPAGPPGPAATLASDAETIAGVLTTKAVTPASNQAKFDVHASDRRIQAPGGSIASDNIIAGYSGNAVASDLGAATILGGGTLGRENVIGGDGSVTVGTGTSNVAETGTGADYSIIPGGYDNVAGGLASVVVGFHNFTGLNTTHGTIGGGSNNKVTGTADYATIGGGTDNEATGIYATVAGGDSNTASGSYSFTAGQNNTASGDGAAVLGSACDVSGASAVAVGQLHDVDGNYSSAFGRGAQTRTQGQRALSSQERAVVGDSQASDVVIRRRTTDGTANQILGVVGSNTTHTLADGQSVAFTVIAVAREAATGDSAMFEIKGLVKKEVATNSALVGTPTVSPLFASTGAATWAMTVAANSAAGSILIRATGQAAKTIDWVARLSMVEVLA